MIGGPRVQIGRPPLAHEAAIIAASATLTLDKALERLDASARLVLTTLALIGTALTGFGLFTDASTRLRNDAELYLIPVGLAVAAAAFALLALLPRFSRTNRANLTAVEENLSEAVRNRGILVTLAMLALLFGVTWAGAITIFRTSDADLTPTLSVVRTQSDAGEGFSVTAKLAGAPDGSVARLRLRENGDVLASQVVGAAGTVEMTVALREAATDDTEIVFALTNPDGTTTQDSVRLGSDGS